MCSVKKKKRLPIKRTSFAKLRRPSFSSATEPSKVNTIPTNSGVRIKKVTMPIRERKPITIKVISRALFSVFISIILPKSNFVQFVCLLKLRPVLILGLFNKKLISNLPNNTLTSLSTQS
jgi:hypothetical protein